MSDYEVLEVPNVLLQRGGLLPMARLAYKTLGTLNPAAITPCWCRRGTRERTTTSRPSWLARAAPLTRASISS